MSLLLFALFQCDDLFPSVFGLWPFRRTILSRDKDEIQVMFDDSPAPACSCTKAGCAFSAWKDAST